MNKLYLNWNNHATTLLDNLISLQVQENFCDATIICNGKIIPVHKFVLSSCSEYFDDIFKIAVCSNPFIVINEVNLEDFEAILKFMYEGKVVIFQDQLTHFIKAVEVLKIRGLDVSAIKDSLKAGTNEGFVKEEVIPISPNPSPVVPKEKPLQEVKKHVPEKKKVIPTILKKPKLNLKRPRATKAAASIKKLQKRVKKHNIKVNSLKNESPEAQLSQIETDVSIHVDKMVPPPLYSQDHLNEAACLVASKNLNLGRASALFEIPSPIIWRRAVKLNASLEAPITPKKSFINQELPVPSAISFEAVNRPEINENKPNQIPEPQENKMFTDDQERSICEEIELFKSGSPLGSKVTRNDLRYIIKNILDRNEDSEKVFKNNLPTSAWIRNFLLRYPKLNLSR